MSAHPSLLICRPQPGADATAEMVRAMGMEALLYPLFRVVSLDWDAPDPAAFDALMLTSANTLRHGGPALDRYRGLPAFAVGEATASAARERGFGPVTVAGPDAPALIDAIVGAGHRHVLHPGGADIRSADPGPLRITRRAVYRSTETGDAQGLKERLRHTDAILAHSPRAARRLAELIPRERRGALALLAISPAAREAAGPGWRHALAAPVPDDAALLALAHQICE